MAKDNIQVFESNPVEVNDSLRVFDRVQSLLSEEGGVGVEPVGEAGTLKSRSWLCKDVSCNIVIFEHHLNEGTKAHDALGVHAALLLHELSEHSIRHALEAASLERAVLITDQIHSLSAKLHLL